MTLSSLFTTSFHSLRRVALLIGALAGAASLWAASPIGQSFTVTGTGTFTLNSVTFQNVSYPYVTPGVANVINIFAYNAAGLNGGNSGYDNATPILFTSTSYSTVGLLSTFNFTGASVTGGVTYYAVFDKGGAFDVDSSSTFAGGDLLYGNEFASGLLPGMDATNFAANYTAAAVPEPSTYAAIFGACALGAVVAIRRRRAVRG